MKSGNKEREIDLKIWLFKFRQKWYYFAISLAIVLGVAFFYVKTSTPLYLVKASFLLGEKSTGSKEAQELLTLLNSQDNLIKVKVDDQIGLLKSASMISRTLNKLGFDVSYFIEEPNILNQLGSLVVKEQFETLPYKVIIDSTSNQIVGQPIYITLLPSGKYIFRLEAENATVYNFQKKYATNKLPIVELEREMEFGKKYNDGMLSFTIVKSETPVVLPEGTKSYFIINSHEALVTAYQANLQVSPISRDSKVLELTIASPVPSKEIKFLDALAAEFKENDLKQKNENGVKTLKFIEKQLATIADSLRKSEEALTTFRSSRNLMDVSMQSSKNLEQLSNLEAERAKLLTTKKTYANILTGIRNNRDVSKVATLSSSGIENPVINNLIIQLSELNRQKAGYSITATERNPILQVLNEKISSSQEALEENIYNAMGSINISLSDIESQIAETKGNLSTLPGQERTLSNLEGKSTFNDKNYAFLLEKRTEASLALATNTSDIKTIDEAKLASTTPVNSKASGIYALSILVGLLIPAGFIVLSDKANDTIKGKEDLKHLTNIPFLGIIAHNPDKNNNLVMLTNHRSAIAESFRSLRINLLYLTANSNLKVIGFTSSISGEGKTFCSVNMSLELAAAGKKIILIETDLRKPTFPNYFQLDQNKGLSTYLTKDVALSEVIQHTDHPNLDIIGSGPIPNSAIEVLELPKMYQLMEILRESYDYVVLDTPPVGFVSEYFIMMQHTDATIYVVRHQYTQKNLLGPINELYEDGKLHNIYTIINDVNYNKTYEYGYKTKAKGYYV